VSLKLPTEMPSKVRARLGSAGFSSDIMDLEVKRLSGGQKARLLLLLVVIEKPDLLILDEPTNHLDIESREALIMALNEYTGSLILVSHDAFLVERLVDRLLIVKDGNVLEFNGDIHEYRKLVLSNNNSKKNKKSNVLSTGVKKQDNDNLSLSDLQKKLKICEKNITDCEKKKSSLQTSILDKDFYTSKNDKEIQEVNNQLKIILSLILEEEKNWEEITDNIEIKKS
jgi:ATP-binding cassette subfamily F protein 3